MSNITKIGWGFLSLLLITAGLIMSAIPGQILAQNDKIELTLRLLPGYYYSEIIPGERETLYMEIVNSGDEAITDIAFFSDKPRGWTVEFRPDSLDYLGAGSHQAIDATIIASPNSDEGEHTVTLIAEAEQARAVTSTILRVENASSVWQWVGLGMGVVVIVGFILLYRRFNRE